MYQAEHNQWYQWKWQLRNLHTTLNNPVIAWYKQIVLKCWPEQIATQRDTNYRACGMRPPALVGQKPSDIQ